LPQVKLCLSDEHQGQRDFVKDGIDMILDHSSCRLVLQSNRHCFQSCTQRLGTHELLTLGENDSEMQLQDLCHVTLLKVVLECCNLELVGCCAVLSLPESIFNQQNSISNNWSLSILIAYFAKNLWVI